MIRRSAGALGVLVALLACGTVSDAAEMAAGPRLALTRLNDSRLELVTVDPSGSDPQVVADSRSPVQPFPISPPSWSADGANLAFVGTSLDEEFHLDIYVQAVTGGRADLVPGTRNGTQPCSRRTDIRLLSVVSSPVTPTEARKQGGSKTQFGWPT
jgi:Tol biopolymer transport system component